MGYSNVKCCICGNRGRLFNFPSGRSKVLFLKEWLKFCKLDEATYLKKKMWFLCGKHFSECCFQNHLKNRLLSVAIPSLYPPGGEGPPTEDGTPPGEFKAETFRKIVHELINKQNSIEPFQRRSKYNTTTDNVKGHNKSEEKENCLGNSSEDSLEPKETLVTSERELPDSHLLCQTVDTENTKQPISTAKQPMINDNVTKKFNNTNHSVLPFKQAPVKKIKLSKIRSNRSLLKINSPGFADFSSSKSNEALKLNAVIALKNVRSSNETVPDQPSTSMTNSGPNNCPKSSVCLNLKSASINTNSLPSLTKSSSKSDNSITSINLTSRILDFENSDSSLSDSNIQTVITSPVLEFSTTNSISSLNKKGNDQPDIFLAAPNNSDISFSEEHFGAEEIVSSKRKQSCSMNSDKHLTSRVKYYDPVLIDSVLSKMKLRKSGPVRVVTLEKQPDRIFKGFTKNKVVTLYKQRLKKKKKILAGNNLATKNKSTDKTVKIRKKRKCTCSIHCQRSANDLKNSPGVINVSSGVGIKFEGTVMNPKMMNIDPDLSDEELFNLETVFNVSTILTNVNSKFQIEQLCQMLIESIFRLKNLNIERTMTKLQVYISQMPSNTENVLSTDKEATPAISQVESNLIKNNNITTEMPVINIIETDSPDNLALFNSAMNCKEPVSSDAVNTNTAIEAQSKNKISTFPSFTEISDRPLHSDCNATKQLLKSKNVTVKLNTFHDHSYISKATNYIFKKPEYLVRLLDIGTYRCPKKKIKPRLAATPKKEIEKHKKVCQKLSNKIIRLRNLLNKKNMSIKSMHGKIKYLGTIVCEEKGIKRVKYPKDTKNIEDKEVLINPTNKPTASEEVDKKRKQRPRKRKKLTEQIVSDNVTTTEDFGETSFDNVFECKIKKVFQKSTNDESLNVLYETLIEEICFSDTEY